MLQCTSCIFRCLRILVDDVIISGAVQGPHLVPVVTASPSRTVQLYKKSYATAADAYLTRARHTTDRAGPNLVANGPFGKITRQQDTPQRYPARHHGSLPSADGGESSDLPMVPQIDKAALEKELRWLRDPMKLAENTVDLLKREECDKALELVRMSSKKMACTVSWNHLVDYEMYKGRVATAMKIYNDVHVSLINRNRH